VWKFRNKIFAFKKSHTKECFLTFITVAEHHSLLMYEIKKIGHRHRFLDSGIFMGYIGRLFAFVMLPWEH
jgi:hypothetical protein